MRIGELAAKTAVSVRSLRYYEEQGLLASTRSASGQRHYGDGAVERVDFIQRLYSAGLSSRTIVELLPCVEAPSRKHSEEALERMRLERDRITERIGEFTRVRDTLDSLIEDNRRHVAVIGTERDPFR